MNISVVLSGGVGVRFGGNIPKQYRQICGKEIIKYVVEALSQHKIIIAAEKKDCERLAKEFSADVVHSGRSHNHTVKNALDYIKEHYPRCKKVLFADSCRPFISSVQVNEYYELLDDYSAVFTAKRITDSLGQDGQMYVERSPYFLIQKPEAFIFDDIYKNFHASSHTTAIVQQMPSDMKIKKYFVTGMNLKITYPEDLPLAEVLIKIQQEGV